MDEPIDRIIAMLAGRTISEATFVLKEAIAALQDRQIVRPNDALKDPKSAHPSLPEREAPICPEK
jgi:hypothetical protein